MVGAIFTRIFALLKQQAARSADRERMGARLEQVTADQVMTGLPCDLASPGPKFLLSPPSVLIAMAEQAAIWAILLAEPSRHIRPRNVVDLMSSCHEQQAVHDPRHMTVDAAAGFRVGRVMGMFCRHRSNILMTPNTHFVGPVPVLERCG